MYLQNSILSAGFHQISHVRIGVGTISSGFSSVHSVNTARTLSAMHNERIKLMISDVNHYYQLWDKLEINPLFTGKRSDAVHSAWEWEKFFIKYSRKGTTKWSHTQKEVIVNAPKGRGLPEARVHHGKNVANNIDLQSDPNYTVIYKNSGDHLHYGHADNFRNESDTPAVNRWEKARKIEDEYPVKRNIIGAGIAAMVGFISTASISLIVDLYDKGISSENFKDASKSALIRGSIGACISVGSYGGYKILDVLSDKIKFLKSSGAKISIIGGVMIVGESFYLAHEMKSHNNTNGQIALEIGKQQAIPIGTLVLTAYIPVIGIFATIAYMSWETWKGIADSKVAKIIEIFEIDNQYKKVMLGMILDMISLTNMQSRSNLEQHS